MRDFIPVNTPLVDGNERKYLQKCIETGWISSEGPFIKEFEARFAELVDRKHAVSVSNGSNALETVITTQTEALEDALKNVRIQLDDAKKDLTEVESRISA